MFSKTCSFAILICLFLSGSVTAQRRFLPRPSKLVDPTAAAVPYVRLYPSVVRLQKGRTKTITAAAYDANNQPVVDAAFVFSTANPNIASTSTALISGDDLSTPAAAPPNLRTISGAAIGTTTITAAWNGAQSNPITVIVDDPDAAPTVQIHGDNDQNGGSYVDTTVGEPIELSAEDSRGVQRIEWNWGDGDRSTELLSATHAYLRPGTYSLNVSVTNRVGQASYFPISVNVSQRPQPTKSIVVTSITELLTAYNNATGGEDIVIPAGTVLDGEIVLPAREFSDYVTIRSSADMPDLDVRVNPNQTGLVTIRGTYANAVPLTIRNGASKIRLKGIKFEPKYIPDANGPSTYYLVQIGEAFSQSDVSQNPTRIILEHCVVNPPDDVSVVHAILNDGYKVSILSSWLGNVRTYGGQDSQAVASYDGRGAHVYNNTFFEATSENVLYGGVTPSIKGVTATNIEFRRCYFSKRLSWRVYNGESHPLNVKNLLETKNARRMYIEGTVFENHWDALRSQLFAFVFKSATSPGSLGQFVPWAISEDIVLENNKVQHIYGGITSAVDNYALGSYFGLKPNNIVVKNVLFDDLSDRWGYPGNIGGSRFAQPNNVEDLRLDHISVIDKDHTAGTSVMFATNNNFRFSITNSIFGLGGYGIIGSGTGVGIHALSSGTSGVDSGCDQTASKSWTISKNVMPSYDLPTNCFPIDPVFGNSYPTSFEDLRFQDLAAGNYALADSSPFKRAASDGTDPGVNIGLLDQRTACSVSGDTAPCLGGVPKSYFTVSGVVTNSRGSGVKALVEMVSANGERRTYTTNQFGTFSFDQVSGGDYTLNATSKRSKVTRPVSVFQDVTNLSLALPN